MSNEKRFVRKGWTPERVGSLKGKTFVIDSTRDWFVQSLFAEY